MKNKKYASCLLLFLFIGKAAFTQDIYHVSNDSFKIAGKAALEYLRKNFCNIKNENFKEAIEGKEDTIFYKFLKTNYKGKYTINSLPILSFINGKETNIVTDSSFCPQNLNIKFERRLNKYIAKTRCYLTVVYLLRKEDTYILLLNANAYSTKARFFEDGYVSIFYFAFDKDFNIKRIKIEEML